MSQSLLSMSRADQSSYSLHTGQLVWQRAGCSCLLCPIALRWKFARLAVSMEFACWESSLLDGCEHQSCVLRLSCCAIQQALLFVPCLLGLNSLLHGCEHQSCVLKMSCFVVQQALLPQHSMHHLHLRLLRYLIYMIMWKQDTHRLCAVHVWTSCRLRRIVIAQTSNKTFAELNHNLTFIHVLQTHSWLLSLSAWQHAQWQCLTLMKHVDAQGKCWGSNAHTWHSHLAAIVKADAQCTAFCLSKTTLQPVTCGQS